jgi:hypothetical protein
MSFGYRAFELFYACTVHLRYISSTYGRGAHIFETTERGSMGCANDGNIVVVAEHPSGTLVVRVRIFNLDGTLIVRVRIFNLDGTLVVPREPPCALLAHFGRLGILPTALTRANDDTEGHKVRRYILTSHLIKQRHCLRPVVRLLECAKDAVERDDVSTDTLLLHACQQLERLVRAFGLGACHHSSVVALSAAPDALGVHLEQQLYRLLPHLPLRAC